MKNYYVKGIVRFQYLMSFVDLVVLFVIIRYAVWSGISERNWLQIVIETAEGEMCL